jgi:DNA-binding HxlR family transcriptional regulator
MSFIALPLLEDKRRFGELRRIIPDVTQRILIKQLRELEVSGVVLRKVYAEVPPKVKYSLTDFGMTLKPIIVALEKWGRTYSQNQK